MKKAFFKHTKGHLTIDDDYFYFTESGHWEEAKSLEEKKTKLNRRSSNPQIYVTVSNSITAALIGIYVIAFISMHIHSFYLILIIWFLSALFQNTNILGLNPIFKIPLNKVSRLKKMDTSKIEIHFLNKENQVDAHLLKFRTKVRLKLEGYLKEKSPPINDTIHF